MDQPGRSGGSLITGGVPPARPANWNDQITEPCYSWNNTREGRAHVNFSAGQRVIRENEHFFNDTVMPGYTPFAYPHPLTSATPGPTPAPTPPPTTTQCSLLQQRLDRLQRRQQRLQRRHRSNPRLNRRICRTNSNSNIAFNSTPTPSLIMLNGSGIFGLNRWSGTAATVWLAQ